MPKPFQANANQSDEIIDVVDADDLIIAKATRAQVHSNDLMHRSSHILVFNSSGSLFLQKRATTKDESPGLWDSSAAGHVESGENYLKCAKRELEEELNLSDIEISEVMSIPAQIKTFWEHVRVYKCITDNEIKINYLEISEGRYWTMSEITQSIESSPKIFTSTFHLIFKDYISIDK